MALGQIIGSSFIFLLTLARLMVKHGFAVPFNINLLLGYTFSVLLLAGWFCSQSAERDIAVILSKLGFVFLFGSSLFLFLNKREKGYFGILRDKFLYGR